MSRNKYLLRYGQVSVREEVLEKFAHWEEWKNMPEPEFGELHLLKLSVFPLCGEFSMNSNVTKSTS
jgi:hypothetical protein